MLSNQWDSTWSSHCCGYFSTPDSSQLHSSPLLKREQRLATEEGLLLAAVSEVPQKTAHLLGGRQAVLSSTKDAANEAEFF